MRRFIRILSVGAAISALVAVTSASAQTRSESRATHRVTINPDGSFTPEVISIRDGDVVEWVLNRRTDAIIPVTEPGDYPTPRAYDPTDPKDFTGPLPLAPSGIFTLGSFGPGLQTEQGGCSRGRPAAIVGNDYLCHTGDLQATMDWTWKNPNATGVFIRLLWNGAHLAPGMDDASFDFTILDREIDKAVRNGKLYSLGFQAGHEGTPDWIFSTDRDGTARPDGGGGVTLLRLQDSGSDDEPRRGTCGVRMEQGSPTDPMFQKHYFDLLTKVASHLRARADRYRALAYIKPSGANLFTLENRLPKRSTEGCLSNPQVFAENGYTPTGLYAFYRRQFDLLATLFPGKAMSYALIQNGFPLVNDQGGWEQPNGSSSNGFPLPRGTEQTERILAIGKNDQGARFVVQHNGLGVQPPPRRCPNEGMHPARPPFAPAGSGCPNRWVLEAGANGQTITGFQTRNPSGVRNPTELESTLQNAYMNSDASFVEIYEEVFWVAANTNNGVLPSGKTLGAWAEDFHARRRQLFPNMPDPFPAVHRHTFFGTGTGEAQTLYYYNPSRIGAAPGAYGTIIILPRATSAPAPSPADPPRG